MHELSENFLLELFKLCFLKTSILEILRTHFKYQYIPNTLTPLKKILKSVLSYYDLNNKIPTYGYVSQQYQSDVDVQEYLSKIKQSDIPDFENIIGQLEIYIKFVSFQLLFQKTKDIFENEDPIKAIELNAKESEEIAKFSIIKDAKYFTKVFGDFPEKFWEKQRKRESGDFIKDKVPFGIDPLDNETYGGADKGDTVLFLARSGIGKSTLLKWIGVYACRLGYRVLHVQLEGSEDECYDKYTQVWTAQKYINVKYGDIDAEIEEKVFKIADKMHSLGKDICIKTFEKFDEANCRDIRDLIIKYEQDSGYLPHLVLIDYLTLLHPGDGLKYGVDTQSIKMKKENSAKKLKNICTEFSNTVRIITADQADNIQPEDYNNPNWVMSRNNVAGAKGLADSFSYFITVNQTDDEKKDEIIRLYFDKLRNYNPRNRVNRIATNFDYGRFYDRKKTIELNNQVIVNNIKTKIIKSDRQTKDSK